MARANKQARKPTGRAALKGGRSGGYAVCQYPGCVFGSSGIARRLDVGWVDLCPPHLAVFRVAPYSDLKAVEWQPAEIRR